MVAMVVARLTGTVGEEGEGTETTVGTGGTSPTTTVDPDTGATTGTRRGGETAETRTEATTTTDEGAMSRLVTRISPRGKTIPRGWMVGT